MVDANYNITIASNKINDQISINNNLGASIIIILVRLKVTLHSMFHICANTNPAVRGTPYP